MSRISMRALESGEPIEYRPRVDSLIEETRHKCPLGCGHILTRTIEHRKADGVVLDDFDELPHHILQEHMGSEARRIAGTLWRMEPADRAEVINAFCEHGMMRDAEDCSACEGEDNGG